MHAESRERCSVDTVAEEDREVVGEKGVRLTRHEIRRYVESDQQEEIIPII